MSKVVGRMITRKCRERHLLCANHAPPRPSCGTPFRHRRRLHCRPRHRPRLTPPVLPAPIRWAAAPAPALVVVALAGGRETIQSVSSLVLQTERSIADLRPFLA